MNDDPQDRRREEIRRALAEAVSPAKLALLVAQLPPDAQERLRQQFEPPPVRYQLKIIRGKGEEQ
jgi:hypothetical protein